MNALGTVIDSWGKKTPADLASEKILAAEKAAVELEKAQAALAAAQAVAEKAKAEAEEEVHRLPPVEPLTTEESTTVPSPAAKVESEDERIARIVVETITSLGVVPQPGLNQSQASAPEPTTQPEITVEKSAVELTLSPAPVAGPTGAKGGNYPASKQNKNHR